MFKFPSLQGNVKRKGGVRGGVKQHPFELPFNSGQQARKAMSSWYQPELVEGYVSEKAKNNKPPMAKSQRQKK